MSLKNQILLCMDEPENYKEFGVGFIHEVFLPVWFCLERRSQVTFFFVDCVKSLLRGGLQIWQNL